jgi:threonylcarbamoyladenosine tRNA methylthiotransferase MtaB
MASSLQPSPRPRAGHRVLLETFGCRVNKYDSAVLRAELAARGYDLADPGEPFDTLILNTCTVTAASDQDTRRLVRRLRRDHPGATIVLTGCYAEVAADEIARDLEVDLILGNRQKASLVDRLDARLGFSEKWEGRIDPLPDPGAHTRFFFKIQEGCDVRCAFCIIPDARGGARSLPPDEVIDTVRRAVDRGFREAILAGIHLGAYGRDLPGHAGLGRLLRRVLDETGLERLRIGSLEPWGVRPDLAGLLRDSSRLMPSIHLPLQSGSEAMLRAMRRPITAQRYRSIVEQLQASRPDLTLWLDVIAGFPGETDALFAESLEFISSLNFTRLHVFPYSIRPGTPAAGMPDQVPDEVKRERVGRLLALSDARFQTWLASRVGTTDEVLVELGGRGHTRDNLPIQLIDPAGAARGEVIRVRLTGVAGDRLLASRLAP